MKSEQTCDNSLLRLKNHIDQISLKFAENTVDLTSAGIGFQREIERSQIIFRELSGEFLSNLDEKKR
jgi:hypothetical protein